MTKHEILKEEYLKDLAHKIVGADYKSTHYFLKQFNKAILVEYLNDCKKDRKILAKKLKNFYKIMDDACEHMKNISELCEPYNE